MPAHESMFHDALEVPLSGGPGGHSHQHTDGVCLSDFGPGICGKVRRWKCVSLLLSGLVYQSRENVQIINMELESSGSRQRQKVDPSFTTHRSSISSVHLTTKTCSCNFNCAAMLS